MRIVEESAGSGSITLYDFEPPPDRLCEDVAAGLNTSPKKLPPKYFYDEKGAELFERITGLEAYYPTRTEVGILEQHADEMAARIGPQACLVEFGSGSGEKTWILLRHLISPAAYVPVDISRAQLVEFAVRVSATFPELPVLPVCADYTAEMQLPDATRTGGGTVAFFPGSTLGNFEPDGATAFLRRVRRLVGSDGGMLLGLDLRKDPQIIERAYNDPEGVTAEFNLNLLHRINRECRATFDVEAFHHYAFFDEGNSRIEMRLVSDRAQQVRLCADPDSDRNETFDFGAGEHIVTEYSHKYDLDRFAGMAGIAGWTIDQVWTDEREWFAVILLR